MALKVALRNARVVELEEPVLRGKLAADRYRKKIHDEDLDRRDANLGRAAVAGSLAGAALGGKLKLSLIKRAALGAGVGTAGVLAVRRATGGSRDLYGERSREAKRAEGLPALAGLGAAGYGLLARGRSAKSKLGALAKFERTFEIRRRPDGTLVDDEEERRGFPVARAGAVAAAVGVLGHRGIVSNYGSYRNAAANTIPDSKKAIGRVGEAVAPVASALGQSIKKDVISPLKSAVSPFAGKLKRRVAPPWAKIRSAIAAIGSRLV